MTSKRKVDFTRSDELQEIDAELDTAMERLDGANQRIDDVLSGTDPHAAGNAPDESEKVGESTSD